MARTPRLLEELGAACAGPDRRIALRLLCEAAFLSSSLLRSLGYPADSWLAAERCRDVAMETQDQVLLGLAGFALACAALSCRSHGRGLALAECAIAALDPHAAARGALELLGLLHLVCAAAGRVTGGADTGDSWAAEAARIARHTGETTTHALYFGPANANLWRLGTEVSAGEAGRALAIAATTDVAAVSVKSRLVFFHIDTARAYADVRGRDHDAVRHLLIAERIAPQHVHSCLPSQETMRALLDRPQRRADRSTLRGMCERMHVGR
jgi:hypothetical protein